MRTTKEAIPTIDQVKQTVRPILERYGATRAGLFGSLARGELKKRSDIDILVEIPQPLGLIAFVGLQQELAKALGRKVDVVEYETIKPRIKERVLAEEIPIL